MDQKKPKAKESEEAMTDALEMMQTIFQNAYPNSEGIDTFMKVVMGGGDGFGMLTGDKVDRKEHLDTHFLDRGTSKKFVNIPIDAKIAFWSFIRAVTGDLEDMEVKSTRILDGAIYVRTLLHDKEHSVYCMSLTEAKFCYDMQQHSDSTQPDIEQMRYWFHTTNQSNCNVRPTFLAAALNIYPEAFALFEYAPEDIKKEFEQFKANAAKGTARLELKTEFPEPAIIEPDLDSPHFWDGNRIGNVLDPVNSRDVATKAYVDASASYVPISHYAQTILDEHKGLDAADEKWELKAKQLLGEYAQKDVDHTFNMFTEMIKEVEGEND